MASRNPVLTRLRRAQARTSPPAASSASRAMGSSSSGGSAGSCSCGSPPHWNQAEAGGTTQRHEHRICHCPVNCRAERLWDCSPAAKVERWLRQWLAIDRRLRVHRENARAGRHGTRC